jgi:hypothetical protein
VPKITERGLVAQAVEENPAVIRSRLSIRIIGVAEPEPGVDGEMRFDGGVDGRLLATTLSQRGGAPSHTGITPVGWHPTVASRRAAGDPVQDAVVGRGAGRDVVVSRRETWIGL